MLTLLGRLSSSKYSRRCAIWCWSMLSWASISAEDSASINAWNETFPLMASCLPCRWVQRAPSAGELRYAAFQLFDGMFQAGLPRPFAASPRTRLLDGGSPYRLRYARLKPERLTKPTA